MSARTLLPYQARWIRDDAPLKIVEKSRRIGLSWAEAYAAVKHAADGKGNVYYQAYDKEMTRGFIDDCAEWAEVMEAGASAVGESVIDLGDKQAVQTFRIAFRSGREIQSMTSAPRAFRSKGRPGDVGIIDEAAFVDDLDEVLKAALAFLTWGGRIRVISTHNGEASPFNILLRDIREGRQPGSVHRITFRDAIEQGLCQRIFEVSGREWTPDVEAGWEAGIRQSYGHRGGEELDCIPSAGTGAWLAWEQIRNCEEDPAGDPAAFAGGQAWIGVDIARRRDLWVAAALEDVGGVLWVRELVVKQGIPFSEQREIVAGMNGDYRPTRIAIDQTGMGEAVVEQLQDDLGEILVEGVVLTSPRRLAVATSLKEAVEDGRLKIPPDEALRRDLHSVRAEEGPTGAPRLVADRGDTDGHADRFWAIALACAAAAEGGGPVDGLPAAVRESFGAFAAPGARPGLEVDNELGIVRGRSSELGGVF